MLSLNNNYLHRYSNAKHVYCITNNNVLSIQQRTFYSVPYKPIEINKNNDLINNAILAYIDRELCCKHIKILQTNSKPSYYEEQINKNDIVPFKISMQELKQLSKFIGLPIAILLDEKNIDDKLIYNVYIDYMRGGSEKDYSDDT